MGELNQSDKAANQKIEEKKTCYRKSLQWQKNQQFDTMKKNRQMELYL